MIELMSYVGRIWWPSPAHKLVALHLADNGSWPVELDLGDIAYYANVECDDALKIVTAFCTDGLIVRSRHEKRLEFDSEILYLLQSGGAHFGPSGSIAVDYARLRAHREEMDRLRAEVEAYEATRYRKAKISMALRRQVWERDDYTCKHCGTKRALTVDHIFPEVHGGTLVIENLQTLCKPCNSRKRDRIPEGAVKQ